MRVGAKRKSRHKRGLSEADLSAGIVTDLAWVYPVKPTAVTVKRI